LDDTPHHDATNPSGSLGRSHLFQLLTGYIVSAALGAVTRLGVADSSRSSSRATNRISAR
jgi:hypothetical protein